MIELTVKTLDSKNHAFSVPDDMTVRQLKEHIASTVNIAAESQRLIYCGRVLQDDKNLSEYDVNGKVIHLVQRAPPVSNGSAPDRGPSTTRSANGASGHRRPPGPWRTIFNSGPNTGTSGVYLGAMAFPAEIMDASGLTMQQPRPCLSQSRLAVASNMLNRAAVILNRLENPPSADTSPDNGNGPPEGNGEEDSAAGPVPVAAAIEISPGSFYLESHEAVASVPSVEVHSMAPDAQAGQSAAPDTSSPTTSTSSDQTSPPSQGGGGTGGEEPQRYARTRVLADLMDQAADINTRVQPFMSRFQQLMRDDPSFSDQAAVQLNQRLFSSVSQIMHNLAHAYHALSDIMCDFSQPPPRALRCRPVLIHHSAVVQTGIPIQVEPRASSQQRSNSSGGSRNNASVSQAQAEAFNIDWATAAREQDAAAQAAMRAAQAAASAPTVPTTTSNSTSTPAAGPPLPPRPERLTPLQPGITPVPVGVGRAGGPGFEFFVDVAPGSITIDSVEAHVVTNTPPNTAEPNNWQNPPEFVQNLITALAGQFMGATLQQYRFPDQQQQQSSQPSSSAPASSSPSSTTGSSTTSSSSSGGAQTQAQTSTQARGSTATHPTTATQTRSTPRPHVHLSPGIHGLRTNNFDPLLPCYSHHIRSRGGSRARGANNTAPPPPYNEATSTPESAPAPRPVPTSISISLRADPIVAVEQTPSRSSGAQSAPSPTGLPPELQALFQNLWSPNAMFGGPQPTTVAQLLQNVPGYSYTAGESIFTDIFMTLAQSLSFLDMVQLGMGHSECLVRARPQLQALISQRLLNNQPLTITAITQLINRFNQELRPHYFIFDNASLREEVDLPASISLYNHSMLPCIINMVMGEEHPGPGFHRELMRKCALYVRQLCALLQYCCLDGATGLEAILRAFVNQMTTGVPAVLQEWTMSHSVLNFRTFISSLNVPVEDIRRFLVYRAGSASSPQPAIAVQPPPPSVELMDAQEIEAVEIESTPSLREPPLADVPPTPPMGEVHGWQNVLPSDWVPIITRDSQRQRRQSTQEPFSDAYLSGMPSKRRKLITSAKPQGNLSQVISESMATALGAAGMSSGPEVEVVAQRAGQDVCLRSAYREQVRATLRQNLPSHPDFSPDKYPNTAKYIDK